MPKKKDTSSPRQNTQHVSSKQSYTKKSDNKIPINKKYKKGTRKFRAIYKKMKHDKIVSEFLQTLNMIKLYHWKTESYATHKATDELHKHLSENIDQFVEVLMGKTNSRINMLQHHLKLYDISNNKDFTHKIMEFRQFLVDLERTFNPVNDSDLFTIRDDMIVHINQFLYLLTLKK